MSFSFLDRIENPKTKEVAKILLDFGDKPETKGIAFPYFQACTAFKKYGGMTKGGDEKISPERLILNMYKIMFVSNISFVPDMIESLTAVYLWNVRDLMYRQIKSSLLETSIYNLVIGKDSYKKSAGIYKVIFKELMNDKISHRGKNPDIEIMNAIIDELDNMAYRSVQMSHVAGDSNRMGLFKEILKSKSLLFEYKQSTGLMVPVSERMDFDRWLEI